MLQAWKNFTAQPSDEPQVPVSLLHRCISLALSGTAQNMYSFDNAEHTMLKHRFAKLEEEFASETEEKDLLATMTKVLKILDIYNQRCDRYVASFAAESRDTIKLLIEMLSRQEQGEQVRVLLQESQQQVEKARTPEDLIIVRKKLETNLGQLEKVNSTSVLYSENTLQELNPLALLIESPNGLRGRIAAKDNIEKVISQHGFYYGVTIRLDCLPMIISRYGSDAGQDFLNAVAHFIIQALYETDALFHWDQSCLFALLDRNLSHDSMTHEVHRLSQVKRELRIDVDGRAVIFAVPISTEFFPISSSSDLSAVVEKIDQFARCGC